MSDVTNDGRTVATDRSLHLALNAEATDRFELQTGGKLAVQNATTSNALESGKTTRTYAGGAHIWTENGELDGKPSCYGEGVDLSQVRVGLRSGRFGADAIHQKANARPPCSRNLLVEQAGVVRSDDRSHQDHFNSYGTVHDSGGSEEAPLYLTQLEKSCTLMSLSGWQNTRDADGKAVSDAPGRSFGPEPGKEDQDGSYLEVTHGARVQLEVVRNDTTTTLPRDPDCAKNHTHWQVYFSGKGMEGEPSHHRPAVIMGEEKVFIDDMPNPCPGLLSGLPELPESLKKELSLDGKVKFPDPTRARYDERVDKYVRGERRMKDDDVRHANYDSRDQSKLTPEQLANAATSDKRQKMYAAAKEWAGAVNALRQYVGFLRSPSECVITARACSGAKSAKVRIFPGDKVELDVFAAFGPQIETILAFVEGAKLATTAISKIVGTVVAVYAEFEYLQSPTCAIGFQYQELDKSGTRRDGSKYYPVQVAPAYSITFGFDPLIKVSFGVKCSLFDLLGVIGRLIKKGADLLKIKADVGIELGIAASVKAGVTRHGDGQVAISGEGMTLKPRIEFFVVFQAGQALRAEVRATFVGEVTLGAFSQNTCGNVGCTFEATMSGRAFLHVTGAAAYDLGGLCEGEVAADWSPKEWQFPSLEAVPGTGGRKTLHLDWFA